MKAALIGALVGFAFALLVLLLMRFGDPGADPTLVPAIVAWLVIILMLPGFIVASGPVGETLGELFGDPGGAFGAAGEHFWYCHFAVYTLAGSVVGLLLGHFRKRFRERSHRHVEG
jgi:hypothetical protein